MYGNRRQMIMILIHTSMEISRRLELRQTGGHENLFLECEWHQGGPQEGDLSEVSGRASAGHPVSAGDQGRTYPGRNRGARVSRVLELGDQEGLFGYGDLFAPGADLRDQRIPAPAGQQIQIR